MNLTIASHSTERQILVHNLVGGRTLQKLGLTESVSALATSALGNASEKKYSMMHPIMGDIIAILADQHPIMGEIIAILADQHDHRHQRHRRRLKSSLSSSVSPAAAHA